MKLLLVVLAVSLLSFIETKSVEDTSKCIVKYLSDKQLLNSSFVVDSVLPDNCYELIDNKVKKMYEVYKKTIEDDDENNEIVATFLLTDMVDLLLKSDFIGDTKKAEKLMSVFKEIIKIEEFFELWSDSEADSFNFTDYNSTLQSPCLLSYSDELIYEETQNINDNNTIVTQDCEQTLISIKKSFENEFLEVLPKFSSDKGQNCISKAYTQLNMTDTFFNAYIYKTKEEELNNTVIESEIIQFLVVIIECVRLTTKETSNTFMIENNFIKALNISKPGDNAEKYRKTHGIIVKLNQEKNDTEVILMANATSEIMKYSSCFEEEFTHIDFKAMALRIISLEEDLDVVQLLKIKYPLKNFVDLFVSFCDGSYFGKTTRKVVKLRKKSIIMKCFSHFLSEEQIDGVTFYRVNVDPKVDDENCNYLYNLTKDDNCVVNSSRKMNFYIRVWTIQFLNQFNVSSQQQIEMQHEIIQIERDFKDLVYSCVVEEIL